MKTARLCRAVSRGTGLSAKAFAHALLEREAVAALPCDSFGPSGAGYIRICLAAPDSRLADAGERILRFIQLLPGELVLSRRSD